MLASHDSRSLRFRGHGPYAFSPINTLPNDPVLWNQFEFRPLGPGVHRNRDPNNLSKRLPGLFVEWSLHLTAVGRSFNKAIIVIDVIELGAPADRAGTLIVLPGAVKHRLPMAESGHFDMERPGLNAAFVTRFSPHLVGDLSCVRPAGGAGVGI